MKIDDNILKFEFDRRANSKNALTEDQIVKLQAELNRVHIKYLRHDKVHLKRMALLNQKLAFAKQIDNLKKKGQKLDTMHDFVTDIEDNTEIITRDDYINMERAIRSKRNELDEAFVVDQNNKNQEYRKYMKGMDTEA